MDSAGRWSPIPVDAEVISLAANDARRTILSVLADHDTSTVPNLGTAVATRRFDADPLAITDRERESIMLELQHVHLPMLADGGALSVAADSGVVRPRDSPCYSEPMASLVAADDVSTSVISALANHRQLRLLSILRDRSRSCQCRDVALQVAAAERDCPCAVVPDDYRQRVYIAIHHRHLPVLRDAGLVESVGDGEIIRAVSPIAEPVERAIGADRVSARSTGDR